MDPVFILLQEVRKRPGIYLGGKSLTALEYFLYGFGFGSDVERWMKGLGHNIAERDCPVCQNTIQPYYDCLGGFTSFVCTYYNLVLGAKNGETIIRENTNSEEEAFDKFYEILDLYFSEQGISRDSYDNNNPF